MEVLLNETVDGEAAGRGKQETLHAAIARLHPYPLLFATITGSHAFGCASPESDYDVHGAHLLSIEEVLGLGQPGETIERKGEAPDGRETDIATHDLRKFVVLLLKGNGNVLEDLYSPLVICSSPAHEKLKRLAQGCITKQLAHHYKGMAFNQQRRMKANELKKYLHLYRCLLMGIHLMRTGELLMDLPELADLYSVPAVHTLIDYKLQGFDFVPDSAEESAEGHFARGAQLTAQLEEARQASRLPEQPSEETRQALEDLVIAVRLAGWTAGGIRQR